MEKTIEEKLSAIKAINSEKDIVDQTLRDLNNGQVNFQIITMKGTSDLPMPPEVRDELNAVVLKYLEKRTKELIQQAIELMKTPRRSQSKKTKIK